MRRSTVSLLVPVLLMVATALLGACGGGGDAPVAEPAFDGRETLQEHCMECHTLSRVTGASKSESGWSQTVDRMIAYGADLNAEERDALVAYLAQEHGQ